VGNAWVDTTSIQRSFLLASPRTAATRYPDGLITPAGNLEQVASGQGTASEYVSLAQSSTRKLLIPTTETSISFVDKGF